MVPFMQLRVPHEVKVNAIPGSEGDEGGHCFWNLHSKSNQRRFVVVAIVSEPSSKITLGCGR